MTHQLVQPMEDTPDQFAIDNLPPPQPGPWTGRPLSSDGHPRQCTARSSNTKERCLSYAIRGGSVCMVHGGRLPNVRAAAQRKLLSLVDPAMDGLLRAVVGKDFCPHCGRSEDMSTVVRAAQVILDRAGFGPTTKIELEQGGDNSPNWIAYATPAELVEALDLRRRARELAERVTARIAATTVQLSEDEEDAG